MASNWVQPEIKRARAVERGEYHIPDFSNWNDHDAVEAAVDDLLRDLRAEADR